MLLKFWTLHAHTCLYILTEEVTLLSCVGFFVIQWTAAYQAPLSMEFSRQSTGVGYHFLLQGIFPTQWLNSDLLHCRQMLYPLSHPGSHILIIRIQTKKWSYEPLPFNKAMLYFHSDFLRLPTGITVIWVIFLR